MVTPYGLKLLHEEQLVRKLTHGKLDLLNKFTWEQDDIHSFLSWETTSHLGFHPIDYCKLYQLNNGDYLARVKIPSADGEKISEYIDHMKDLCYGDDLKGRVIDASYKLREPRNFVIIYFSHRLAERFDSFSFIIHTRGKRDVFTKIGQAPK